MATIPNDANLLDVDEVDAGYNKTTVLKELSLNVARGEIVGILGTNGAGKSTLARVVAGIVRARSGSVSVNGSAVTRMRPDQRVARGVCLVPEGGGAFRGLSVRENLLIGGTALKRHEVDEQMNFVHDLFPVLRERGRQDAGLLSGGERQMLAVGRALMGKPELLILDEPSIGLSPVALDRLFAAVRQLVDRSAAKDRPFGLLLTEQNVHEACRVVDRAYVLKLGKIVAELAAPKPDQVASLISESLGDPTLESSEGGGRDS
jgi:branched-chain amino acid transport system ATP-binding protein